MTTTTEDPSKVVHVLDYGAGNVRSLENAVVKCGYIYKVIQSPEEILNDARVLVFPGVGSFGNAMKKLQAGGYVEPLKQYIAEGRRFFGICIGMQTLFAGSEEDPGVEGLGVLPGRVRRFPEGSLSVPHMGWNGVRLLKPSRLFAAEEFSSGIDPRVYFVHSYCAPLDAVPEDWLLGVTTYGAEFAAAVQKGNVMATQFHPEKSGALGLAVLKGFLDRSDDPAALPASLGDARPAAGLSRRVIACLDVRANDDGDLVVTKGDGYDVRERPENDEGQSKGAVRNFGQPAELARRYFEEGADEITFLNITQFREDTLDAESMHAMLQAVSRNVFVPLTIGGGIRDYGQVSALQVASKYFRSGADKVSLGSYAVEAVLRLRDELKGKPDGSTAIEKISNVYGAQAVVISVDPRRIYLNGDDEERSAREAGYAVFEVTDDRTHADVAAYEAWLETSEGREARAAPAAPAEPRAPRSAKCWFQCTVAGGRKRRPLDAVQLAMGVEMLGAGEVLLNSIDKDGKNAGFDIALVNAVRAAVSIPVIASSGAGSPEHFVQVFSQTKAEAALAAGIFHRREVPIEDVKRAVAAAGLPVRL